MKRKKKCLVLLITNLNDLCLCVFYGLPSFPSNAYGTWDCAAPKAVALTLRQLSILRVRKKTFKQKRLLNAQDVASICSTHTFFSPFILFVCNFFCFLFTQPVFTNLGRLSYPSASDRTCKGKKEDTHTLRSHLEESPEEIPLNVACRC